MIIQVLKNRTVGDVQQDFNNAYPFLKIEFYPKTNGKKGGEGRLNKSVLLHIAGILKEGELPVSDLMTVGELEKIFKDNFGAIIEVSRKSGSLWLETTMTNNWTLKQQNDHGRELSTPVKTSPGDNEIDYN